MSNNLDNERIILPAWKLVSNDSKIKKFYLFPSLLSTIFLTALLVYQSIYTYFVVLKKETTTEVIGQMIQIARPWIEGKYSVELFIAVGIFLLLYFFLIPIFEGGLIKYIDSKNNGTPIGISDTIGFGLHRFLPVFEYDNLFSEFKLINILNFYLFTIRFVGIDYIKIISIIYIILAFFCIILNILFAYARYSIVLNKKLVFKGIGESVKISVLNLKVTIKLYFLIFFLNFRVLVNFLIFLLFPIGIIAAIGFISTKFLMILAVVILSVIFIVLIFIISYLTAVLDVFKTTLWYYAYKESQLKIKDECDDDD